jgi:formate dehydrogenase major subunit
MTNDLAEFSTETKCFLITGSNTSENHPIIGMHVFRGIEKGAKLIVIDPRKTEMANKADVFLQVPPGYNIPVMNSLIHVIINEKLYDKDFVEKNTKGFDYLKESIQEYSPEKVAKLTGLDSALIIKAAKLYAEAKPAAILYAMGMTQFSHGTGNVWTTSNLAAITGNLGIKGGGVNPLRGQNNVQGACMVGALPTVFASGKPVTDDAARSEVESLWHSSVPSKPGFALTVIPENIENGNIKFLWVFGENPVMSDPDTDHFTHSLDHLEFMVSQDIFMSETCIRSDMVLPAACFAEKEGTFVNTSRRVQMVNKAVDAPGEAKADWEIIAMVAEKLNQKGFDFRDARDIWDEIRIINRAQFGGMDYRRLKEMNGINAPCPNHQHQGTPVLHEGGKFSTPDGKAMLIPILFTENADMKDALEKDWRAKLGMDKDYPMMVGSLNEKASEKYPYILTTGRYVYQYHTGTMTRKCKSLETGADVYGPAGIEIGIDTAKKLGLATGDFIKVENERGCISSKARVMNRISRNVVFGSFHYWESNINELTNPSGLDPVSKIPELKVTAVNIVKITEDEYLAIQEEKKVKFKNDQISDINKNILPGMIDNNLSHSIRKGV